jgi:prepilin-type N-terminal cleavage/methylation domain-containing protein
MLMHIRSGFTIVEIIIVVTVVAILAGITTVAYNGFTDRARTTALEADLTTAAKRLTVSRNQEGRGLRFPDSIPSDFQPSSGNVLQLTHTGSNDRFCINGYGTKENIRLSYDSQSATIRPYLCGGYAIGSPSGGAVPTAPTNTNLAGDFSTWSTSTGAIYHGASGEIRLSETTAGSAYSPLIRIDGASRARLSVEAYATKPSPQATPNTQVYFGSSYFDAAGNPVQNTSNYTGNGNAQVLPLNEWKSFSWVTPTGPNVMYVRFNINSNPGGRTSDNRFRSLSIEAV